MRPTERESPKQQEGVSSRIFPSTSSSIEQVRDFLEERLQAALRPGEIRDENAPSSLHLTIRVMPDHIEVTVGGHPRGVRFREWLGDALHGQSMSQETAARRLGVSLKTVNRWLRGHSEPRMRELRRVRQVFGDPPLE